MNFEKMKDKMKGTCCGSLAYCCGLEKQCPDRDRAISNLGITKNQFILLKNKFDDNLLSLIKRKNR